MRFLFHFRCSLAAVAALAEATRWPNVVSITGSTFGAGSLHEQTQLFQCDEAGTRVSWQGAWFASTYTRGLVTVAIMPIFAYLKLPPNASLLLTNGSANVDLNTFFAPDTVFNDVAGPRTYQTMLRLLLDAPCMNASSSNYGVRLDAFVPSAQEDVIFEANATSERQDVCGRDQSEHVTCSYSPSAPRQSMYAFGRPVARIIVNPGSQSAEGCTGWLWGSAGHLITNHHCIGSEADALNAQFQFVAESYLCSGNRNGVCAGVTEAITATLIYTNATLDFTLVKLRADLPAKYGYLQAAPSPASVGMRVYMPQHPRGGCKLLSYLNDDDQFTTISSLATPGCDRKGGYAYNVDTDGGSSGSPVLSKDTNTVVALHYCGATACRNAGIPMLWITQDLGRHNLLPPNGIASGAPPLVPPFSDPTVSPYGTNLPGVESPFTKQAVIDGVIIQVGSFANGWATNVDHITFQLATPGVVVVDVLSFERDGYKQAFADVNDDCRIAYLDTMIYVFSNDSTVQYTPYANDDVDSVDPNAGKADGSISPYDSYLVAVLPAGAHTVAIGATNLGLADARRGRNGYPYTQLLGCSGVATETGDSGAYRVTLSATVPLTIKHSNAAPKMAECAMEGEAALIRQCEAILDASYEMH
ncbi:hypothetical protein SPRG_00562 [Saprolegnia parasitica CBS 223.65]|uniref:Serine protease n=1 Tax=Saprolegnia parasitica (strain CBS 223.65) TaxID=695850 RepID=A0A067CUW3_SAPPC|nr:hypothetical protein SPRG_00562 [Saprolegnia parasitica CBS 223.65]KDO34499.1 hypothetical protein SPRG_00562 [Saprolegnia parasitica CBS 223.65]|eukprot:XP_012194178.1 hypothetical protein SPRG_00562 [Saprolegnia parasitica CBS 223.65]